MKDFLLTACVWWFFPWVLESQSFLFYFEVLISLMCFCCFTSCLCVCVSLPYWLLPWLVSPVCPAPPVSSLSSLQFVFKSSLLSRLFSLCISSSLSCLVCFCLPVCFLLGLTLILCFQAILFDSLLVCLIVNRIMQKQLNAVPWRMWHMSWKNPNQFRCRSIVRIILKISGMFRGLIFMSVCNLGKSQTEIQIL